MKSGKPAEMFSQIKTKKSKHKFFSDLSKLSFLIAVIAPLMFFPAAYFFGKTDTDMWTILAVVGGIFHVGIIFGIAFGIVSRIFKDKDNIDL